MSQYSSLRAGVPITKNQLTSLLTLMDAELNTAEISIVGNLPAGDGKTWILANDPIGRDMIARIETKRRDVL